MAGTRGGGAIAGGVDLRVWGPLGEVWGASL